MRILKCGFLCGLLSMVSVRFAGAEVDSLFHVYLLFGQSNMAGGAGGSTDQAGRALITDECDTNPRVKVMAFGDCNQNSNPCPNLKVVRKHGQSYTAFPPYHNCHEGVGPADEFGRVLLDSIRKDITIGFVPCALSGQNIAVFEKGKNAMIDDHTRPVINGQKLASGAYEWMRDKCKIAQQTGVIKGILFHQGESNSGESTWPDRVKKIVNDLKQDLNLWDSIPFIAGEMRYDGCCKAHNVQVNKLPGLIPNCRVASAEGLERRSASDNYHFSMIGEKEFGIRYAKEFLKVASQDWVPRIGDTITTSISKREIITPAKLTAITGPLTIYSLDGRVVADIENNRADIKKYMQTGKLYIVTRKVAGKRSLAIPVIN